MSIPIQSPFQEGGAHDGGVCPTTLESEVGVQLSGLDLRKAKTFTLAWSRVAGDEMIPAFGKIPPGYF